MTFFIVYETTNLINNKKYIGIHKCQSLDDGYLGSGTSFRRAVSKYGKESFSRKVLFTFNNLEEALLKEKELVTEEIINSKEYYNIRLGGDGKHVSTKTKTKMSNFRKKFEKSEKGKKARISNIKARSIEVIATNLKTGEIRKFSSIVECAKELNLVVSLVSMVCKKQQNRTQHKGWTFETKKYGKSLPITSKSHIKEGLND